MDKICIDYLQQQWHELTPRTLPSSSIYFDQLLAAYSGPPRFYHTPQHLYHLIHLLRDASIVDPAVYWAGFYHDYVYIAGKQDNEAKSAELAKKQMIELNINGELIDRCCELILLTKNHLLSKDDPDAAAFLDADMAILGANEKAYVDYIEKVRKEYATIPEFLYNRGRMNFLKTCLNQKRLFITDWFFERFETRARKNLAWELSMM